MTRMLLALDNLVPVIQASILGPFMLFGVRVLETRNHVTSPLPKRLDILRAQISLHQRDQFLFPSTLIIAECKAVALSIKGLIMSVIKKIIRSIAQ